MLIALLSKKDHPIIGQWKSENQTVQSIQQTAMPRQYATCILNLANSFKHRFHQVTHLASQSYNESYGDKKGDAEFTQG